MPRKEIEYTVNENGCWVCTSHFLNPGGYPRIRRDPSGRQENMNTWVLRQKLGRELKAGFGACHTCNNRQCINPEHLYEGSPLDNTGDSVNVRTHRVFPKGEDNPKSRLTEDAVRYIRNNLEESNRTLSRKYGVTTTTIKDVKTGHTWRQV
jgi:hypothetical protein